MRAAPLKGDCVICQAPDSIRVAINAAIWPADGVMRAVNYRAEATRIGQESGNPKLASLNVKTITRHADHVEASWREVAPGSRLRDDEAPLQADFSGVMDAGARLGALGLRALTEALEGNPEAWAVLRPKETIAMAKLGIDATVARETSRLKRNQQAIDVMAIFASSSGHIPAPVADVDEDDEDSVDYMRAAIDQERKLLAERAG